MAQRQKDRIADAKGVVGGNQQKKQRVISAEGTEGYSKSAERKVKKGLPLPMGYLPEE